MILTLDTRPRVFRDPRIAREERASKRLLIAVLHQAFDDLARGDAGYEKDGQDCMCEVGQEGHGFNSTCPRGRPYHILPAKEWVEDCSFRPWGFGWVCQKLQTELEAAGLPTNPSKLRVAILGSAKANPARRHRVN